MTNKDVLQELKIKKFDIKSLARDSTICVVGKRRTGKSVLVKDIMYHFRHIPKGAVFSGTEHCSPFFRHFVPDMYISQQYDADLLEKIFKKQDQIINRDGRKTAENNIFLIMDDMLADSGAWKKDRQIRELLMNGRHRNVFFVLTLQYPLGIPPDLRSNLDYIFIFRDNILANRRRIWENFAGVIPKFQTFISILEQTTEDFNCLVINNNSQSNKLEDIVFWYKADPNIPRFRCGNRKYWKAHDERYKSEDLSMEEDVTMTSQMMNTYGNKSKNFKIILQKS